MTRENAIFSKLYKYNSNLINAILTFLPTIYAIQDIIDAICTVYIHIHTYTYINVVFLLFLCTFFFPPCLNVCIIEINLLLFQTCTKTRILNYTHHTKYMRSSQPPNRQALFFASYRTFFRCRRRCAAALPAAQ